MKQLMSVLLALCLCGCGTFIAHSHLSDPCVTKVPRYMYKGVIIDAGWVVNGALDVDPLMFVKGLVDLPFSLTADTILFPVAAGREFLAKGDAQENELVNLCCCLLQINLVAKKLFHRVL